MSQPFTDEQLHAGLDGQLSAEAMAELDAWLREHPQDAARIAQYRRQNAALHATYDHILDEPVPEHLRAVLMSSSATPRFSLSRYAAVVAWLSVGGVVGSVVGWKLHERQAAKTEIATPAAPPFARQAAIGYAVYSPEVKHAVEVGADQETHLVEWLSKRLNTKLRVPHLADQGYALVGGRLLPGTLDERAPIAQFMYQDDKKRRLTLHVRVDANPSREAAFQFAQEKNIGVFYWVDQKLGYALSGEIEKTELLQIANAVYKQLHP